MRMKKILAFGDSNTWGFVPGGFDPITVRASRYPREHRWAGVMANLLGAEYEVIEEGLNGRTAVLDDPFLPFLVNGKTYLLPCLLSHSPLDLVAIMLGTNELKSRFNLNASEIARGIRQLIWLIKSLNIGTNNKVPEILIMAPSVANENVGDFKSDFVGSTAKSKEFAKYYSEICKIENCHFLDANLYSEYSNIDGIHYDKENQIKLGQAMFKVVKQILG